MLATTPVVIAVVSAVLGHERIGRTHWLGAAISTAGIYLVVGRGFALGGERMTGDLMMFGAVCCWALYTLAARPLMSRHSPVAVTGSVDGARHGGLRDRASGRRSVPWTGWKSRA